VNILVVEDDARISDFLVRGLRENGFAVTLATSGEQARDLVAEQDWNTIIIDIMLPGIDGIQLIKLIRFKQNYTPILVLSALGGPDDKALGLDSGADDYLAKPFHFKELVSRLNALVRRAKLNYEDQGNILSCADLSIDLDQHAVVRGGQPVQLSPREFKLLRYLVENKNKVLTRAMILNRIWGIDHNNYTNVVDVYISYLRNKIDEGHEQKLIHTIKGVGYILKEG
jgi:two-component system, OmpR family, response regulator